MATLNCDLQRQVLRTKWQQQLIQSSQTSLGTGKIVLLGSS